MNAVRPRDHAGSANHLGGLAAAFGERLAPGVEVVERAAGLQVHQLAPVLDLGNSGSAPELALWASQGAALRQRRIVAGPGSFSSTSTGGPSDDWALGPELPQTSIVDRCATRVMFPWLQMALRRGIHHVWRLRADHGGLSLLVGVQGRLLRFDQPPGGRSSWSVALRYPGFDKPAQRGLLVDSRGRIWVATYDRNLGRTLPVHLWRSDDGGQTFWICHSFGTNKVRHLHFIQEDPWDGSLWLGTGDRDHECGLWRSSDGDTWRLIGGGSQTWRAVGLAFGRDAIRWGTDAGRDASQFVNCAVRLDRRSGLHSLEQELQGPVHGVSTLPDGRTVLTTGCEGGNGRRSPRVHLWIGTLDGHWRELASWQRGVQPARLQYAVAHLVHGQEQSNDLWVQLRGTLSAALGIVRLRIPESANAKA